MTAITINIPNHEVSFFKKMIKKMGWTYTVAGEESTATKTRIYDPETGRYLKDSVVKSIEQAHEDLKNGKLKAYDSVDEMFQELGINV